MMKQYIPNYNDCFLDAYGHVIVLLHISHCTKKNLYWKGRTYRSYIFKNHISSIQLYEIHNPYRLAEAFESC